LAAASLESIAQRLNGDVRQLHGAVNRLHVAELARMNLQSWPNVYSVLQDLFQAGRRPVSLETIEQAVSDVCGVAGAELRSSKRSKRINVARDLAMWLARKHIGSAYAEIGSHYGGRSHSTVISAQKKVHRWLQSGETIALPDQQRCPAGEIIQQIEWKLRIG
jgi:chromosomal replication initiator protein